MTQSDKPVRSGHTIAAKVNVVATAALNEEIKKELEIPDPEEKEENNDDESVRDN